MLDIDGRGATEGQVNAGHEAEGRAPAVGREFELVGFGEGGHATGFGDAAHDGTVGLEDVDRSRQDQVAEVEAGEFALPRRDRRGGAPAHLRGAGFIVGSDGLLEPVKI